MTRSKNYLPTRLLRHQGAHGLIAINTRALHTERPSMVYVPLPFSVELAIVNRGRGPLPGPNLTFSQHLYAAKVKLRDYVSGEWCVWNLKLSSITEY